MGLFTKVFKILGVDLEQNFDNSPNVSDKSKTDAALPYLVGTDYVKCEPIRIFKRLNSNEEQVGEALAWFGGFSEDVRGTLQFYADDILSTDPLFQNDPTTPEISYLAHAHFAGHPNNAPSQWNTFITQFGWRTDCPGKNVCYSLVKWWRNGDIFKNGEPKFHALAKRGSLLMTNLQKVDSDDAKANNPVLVSEMILRDPIFGLGVPSSSIGTSFTTLANYIETNLVTQYTGGPSVKRFTVNGLIPGETSRGEKLRMLEDHFYAKIVPIGTSWEVNIKGIDDTPVMDLNDSNLVGDIEVEYRSASDKYNRVTVKFKNPQKNFDYDFATFPPQGDPLYDTWLAEDEFLKNEKTYTRDLCNNYYEALKMAEVLAKESRELVNVVKVRAQTQASILIPYDVITITDDHRGWSGQQFLVESIEEVDNGLDEYDLELSWYNPTIYEWAERGEYIVDAPYTPPNTRPDKVTGIAWDDQTRFLSWNFPAGGAKYYIVTVDGDEVGRPAVNSLQLDLSIGSYDITVTYVTNFATSFVASQNITVALPATPGGGAVSKKDGLITVQLPELSDPSNMYYNIVYTTNDALDPSTDSLSLFDEVDRAQNFKIPFPVDGQTYYIWYQVVAYGVAGNWIELSTVAQGVSGIEGPRGAGDYIATDPSYTAWTDVVANLATPGNNVIGDSVTITNETNFSEKRYWNGISWILVDTVIDANWIFNSNVIIQNLGAGTISADKVNFGSGLEFEGDGAGLSAIPNTIFATNSGGHQFAYTAIFESVTNSPALYLNANTGGGSAATILNNDPTDPALFIANSNGAGTAIAVAGSGREILIWGDNYGTTGYSNSISHDSIAMIGEVLGENTNATMSLGGFFVSNSTTSKFSSVTADGVFDQNQRVFSANNLPTWSQITGKPTIPSTAADVGALGATATATNSSALQWSGAARVANASNSSNTIVARNANGDSSFSTVFYTSLVDTCAPETKKDIVDITDSLEVSCALAKEIKAFSYNDDKLRYKGRRHGFMSDKVKLIKEDLTEFDDDGNLGVKTLDVVAYNTGAIDALHEIIKDLQQEVERLKKKAA